MFGLWSDNTNHDEPILNHVLLIFKLLHLYNLREKHRLNITDLLNAVKEIKKTEYRLYAFVRFVLGLLNFREFS